MFGELLGEFLFFENKNISQNSHWIYILMLNRTNKESKTIFFLHSMYSSININVSGYKDRLLFAPLRNWLFTHSIEVFLDNYKTIMFERFPENKVR